MVYRVLFSFYPVMTTHKLNAYYIYIYKRSEVNWRASTYTTYVTIDFHFTEFQESHTFFGNEKKILCCGKRVTGLRISGNQVEYLATTNNNFGYKMVSCNSENFHFPGIAFIHSLCLSKVNLCFFLVFSFVRKFITFSEKSLIFVRLVSCSWFIVGCRFCSSIFIVQGSRVLLVLAFKSETEPLFQK